jgi:hypothetical protein
VCVLWGFAGQGLTKWSDQMTLDFAILTWLTEASRVKSSEFDTIENGKQTGGVLTVASAAASVGALLSYDSYFNE